MLTNIDSQTGCKVIIMKQQYIVCTLYIVHLIESEAIRLTSKLTGFFSQKPLIIVVLLMI